MKRLLLALVAVLCLGLVAGLALADNPDRHTAGAFEYVVLEDGTAELANYNGKAENLAIPAELDGYRVESIGGWAFSACTSLKSLTIPDSVTNIDEFAFDGNSSLTSVTLPDSITSVGTYLFLFCEKLSQIYVSPDHPTLATIDDVLFSKADKRLIRYPPAKKADSYEIPNGITIIDEYAFYCCSNLTSVIIPSSVISIEVGVFSKCSSLISVTIPDSIKSIADEAFCDCESLASVAIPSSITSIGESAFYYCNSLTSVTIPNRVTSIGKNAFSLCTNLTRITIPESVTSIGSNAFYKCPCLVTVPLGSYAAQYCKENGLKYQYPDSLDWLTN